MIEVLNSSKGIYRHTATGFTLHEVYSIDDVAECNGCIACTEDVWVWVAGRDLAIEIKRFGGGMSLEGLARSLMANYNFNCSGMEFSQGQNTDWGGSNSLCVSLPGIYKAAKTVSSLRLFGIVTNAAAGRGASSNLIGATTGLYGSGYVQYRGAWAWKASRTSMNENLRRSPVSFRAVDATLCSTFVGRAIIAIPFKSWAEFKKQWKNALPNIDEGEVLERANHAVSQLSDDVLKMAFGEVPTIFVPVALYSDGTAAIERSSRPRMYNRSDYPRNNNVQYSIYLCPSLPESETGWWMTNPLGLGKGEKQVKIGATPNDALITGVSYEPASPEELVGFTAPTWPCKSVGGVELFKILGGLYPRVDSEGVDVEMTAIINEAFKHAGCEESLPTKGANETDDEYNTRISVLAAETAYDVITTLPCTWQFAGQPAVLTNWLLNSFLDGSNGRMTNACAAILATGHYYAKGRSAKGTVFSPEQSRTSVTVADLSLSVK